MLFKSHKPAKSRQSQPLETPEYDVDMLSKDKAKQKEAVKRYLAERVRTDWEFEWPPRTEDHTAEELHHPVEQFPLALAADTDEPGATAQARPGDGVDVVPASSETSTTAEPQGTPICKDNELEAVEDHNDDEAVKASGDEADSESGHHEDDDDDGESVYSTVSEDFVHFRARLEWSSDLSDDEPAPSSPYRFESPDSVGAAVRANAQTKKDQRRRAVRDETKWNPGLACFEARRNAWTGARVVRVRQKQPSSPGTSFSPLSPRRFFFRNSLPNSPTTAGNGAAPTSPASPTAATAATGPHTNGHSLAHGHHHRASNDASVALSDSSDPYSTSISKPTTKSSTPPPPSPYPVEILLPLAPPLLPPGNPMRAGINPSVYLPLYDKIIINGLAPSCPVNLADMLRACVCGWKRDGEWPPRAAIQEAPPAGKKRRKRYDEGAKGSVGSIGGSIGRRMSFGFLGSMKEHEQHREGHHHKAEQRDGEDHGKGIRKSLQRVLGLGHGGHHADDGPYGPNPVAKI